jgi:hypothetical protein
MKTRNRLRVLPALLGAVLLVTASCDGPGDEEVTAMNLSTGDTQTFSSASGVPEGWATCTDVTCSNIATTVPCTSLGQKVCTLQPECRLKEVYCTGSGTTSSNGTTTGGQGSCTYTCIAKLPLLCEELPLMSGCIARADCEWGATVCPACATQNGLPCPCTASCRTKAVATCDLLDAAQCKARLDCTWLIAPCPLGVACGTCEPAAAQPL